MFGYGKPMGNPSGFQFLDALLKNDVKSLWETQVVFFLWETQARMIAATVLGARQ